jgi:hypothetical protein
MTKLRPSGEIVAAMVGALLALVVVPAIMSVAHGDGAICFASVACPLSAINPCVRHPSFALIGRCAVVIR